MIFGLLLVPGAASAQQSGLTALTKPVPSVRAFIFGRQPSGRDLKRRRARRLGAPGSSRPGGADAGAINPAILDPDTLAAMIASIAARSPEAAYQLMDAWRAQLSVWSG
ncbi:MAG: hypothetical protein VB959_14080 [Rhodospirillales bacterium]